MTARMAFRVALNSASSFLPPFSLTASKLYLSKPPSRRNSRMVWPSVLATSGLPPKEQAAHVFGNGDSGDCRLSAQTRVLLAGKPERPAALKTREGLVFCFHAFPAFSAREKRSAECAVESRGAAFGKVWLSSDSYQLVKKKTAIVMQNNLHSIQ